MYFVGGCVLLEEESKFPISNAICINYTFLKTGMGTRTVFFKNLTRTRTDKIVNVTVLALKSENKIIL